MEVFSDATTSVASFGATARVGKANTGHMEVDSSGNAVFTGSTSGNSVEIGGTSAAYAQPGFVVKKGGTETYELRTADATPLQEAIRLVAGTTKIFPRVAYNASRGFGVRYHVDGISFANYTAALVATQFLKLTGSNTGNVYLTTSSGYRFTLTDAGNLRLDVADGTDGSYSTDDYFLKQSCYINSTTKAGSGTNSEAISSGSSYTFTANVTVPDGYIFTGLQRWGRSGTGSSSLVLQGVNTNATDDGIQVTAQYRNVGSSSIAKNAITFNVEARCIKETLTF